MNRKIGIATAAAAIVAVAGIMLWPAGDEGSAPAVEAANIKQLVADYSSRSLTAESASIDSRTLAVTGTGNKVTSYELPEDEFFVSIAPYIDQTHPCAIHNLAGCQGELANEPFQVTVTDADGNKVLSEPMNAHPNGFIDLWLPREQTYKITIEHEGRTAESDISTYEDDNTCITTMQLS